MMKTYILKIPNTQNYDHWFPFVEESLAYTDKDITELIVDFNNVKFMNTDDFVVLACLIESFYLNGANINFIGGTRSFNAHLNNIKFKLYWTEGFDRNKFTVSHNETTLCLWKISKTMIHQYAIYARRYFEKFAKDKDLIPISSNIDEVFNNVFDHSESPVTGYIITQYYPKNNKLSFSVCDFGIGIPTSVNRSNIIPEGKIDDWKAILRSLDQGFSVNSTPQNRGFGLNNLLEFTESSNGRLSIISNNGLITKKAGGLFHGGFTGYNFSGTLITADVDLSTFEEKDESELIFDF